MCILCKKEYKEKTTEIYYCCSNVTEIPLLPNLTHLNCSYSKITEIPLLPNLTFFNCSRTKITELLKIPNCEMYYNNCLWLKEWYEKNGNLDNFIFLEDKIKFLQKQYQKKKWNKIHKSIPLIRDIKNIIKSY